MKITSFGLSVPAATIGTVTSSLGVRDVAMASNTIPAAGYVMVASSSNTMEWRDALSFGSNTNDVSSVGTMGASASNTREDHVHRGVHLVSAAGSNPLYGDVNLVAGTGMAITTAAQSITLDATARVSSNSSNAIAGPVNLAAGTNIALGVSGSTITITSLAAGGGGGSALTVEEVDGSPTDSAVTKIVFPNGTLGIASHVATYTPTVAGGLTQAYVGYDTAGGSWETMTTYRTQAKKVTLANDCLVTSIEAYVRNDAAGADDQVESLSVAIYSDVAGTPGLVVAYATNPTASILMDSAAGAGGDGVARWLGVPIGKWLVAGDYWIAVANLETSVIMQIAYDGSGSDRYYTAGGGWFADWGWYSPTTSSNKYSIRANTIR